jgi:hypothetical protein
VSVGRRVTDNKHRIPRHSGQLGLDILDMTSPAVSSYRNQRRHIWHHRRRSAWFNYEHWFRLIFAHRIPQIQLSAVQQNLMSLLSLLLYKQVKRSMSWAGCMKDGHPVVIEEPLVVFSEGTEPF